MVRNFWQQNNSGYCDAANFQLLYYAKIDLALLVTTSFESEMKLRGPHLTTVFHSLT